MIIIATFPYILLNTSPGPIGLKPGFLLRGINPHATTKLSKEAQLLLLYIFVIHNFLTSSVIALRRSDVVVSKHDETIILLHPSASSPDDPTPPFALIASFFISSSSISPYTIGCIPLTSVERYLLHQDFLTLITEVIHLLEVKWHRLY